MAAVTPFLQDFDTILNGILTDYQNQFPDADISKGTLIFIKSACLASALWGLYKKADWVAKQIFPDTADTDNMYHHGWVVGLAQKPGETDAEYLARLLAYIQQPPAGGNDNDYEQWSLSVGSVKAAYTIPMGQGYGTVDVVVIPDPAQNNPPMTDGTEVATPTLLAAVLAFINGVRPVTAKWIRTLGVIIITQNVTMTTSGSCNTQQTAADITAFMAAFIPGQPLNLTQLAAIAIKNGATDAVITIPVANVPCTGYQMIRPGVINVS